MSLIDVGLFLFPALLTEDVQIALLDRLMHRDLSNPAHKTNMHLFHYIEYPAETSTERNQDVVGSFFGVDPDQELQPKDATIHKPITVERMLQRKLRWMTLGGQYNWTAKVYPDEQPPEFPADIAQLLRAYFPDVDPEAAIINFYSPGDTLSVHRDVSEDCDRGLISISLGCDGIFLVGNEDASRHATIRLRSGDAVLMTGKSRFAWHAVPKVLSNTCPKWLEALPAAECQTLCERWRGWMKTKRININVRQMRDRSHGE
jgi:DNA alkylation damage repair protein AlkB